MDSPKILTLSDVAKLLSVHPITVYRMIKQGKLPAFRIGRVLRFDAIQIEDWLHAKERKTPTRNHRRRPKASTSAEYLAYPSGGSFARENLLETLAITRPTLVRLFVEAKQTRRKTIVCERCGQSNRQIAALMLFASEQSKRPWKKAAMPFCRGCFSALRKLATPEASGTTALEAASRINRRQTRRPKAR